MLYLYLEGSTLRPKLLPQEFKKITTNNKTLLFNNKKNNQKQANKTKQQQQKSPINKRRAEVGRAIRGDLSHFKLGLCIGLEGVS